MKTFLEEFTEACRKLDAGNSHLEAEAYRVHQDTVRDSRHAFSRVEIKGPDPWKQGTELTI